MWQVPPSNPTSLHVAALNQLKPVPVPPGASLVLFFAAVGFQVEQSQGIQGNIKLLPGPIVYNSIQPVLK